MSQWHDVLRALQNATGGWVSTHDIYDELHIKNPSQRIDEIERLGGFRVEREVVTINGKRAARYRLARQDRTAQPASPAAPPDALFEQPPAPAANDMWKAA